VRLPGGLALPEPGRSASGWPLACVLAHFGNGPAVLPLEAPLVGPGHLISAGCALMCALGAGAAVGAVPRRDAGQIRQETEERSQARLGVLRLIGNDSG